MTARECGEQHEAKDQPQKSKDLNTIRPGKLTSRRRGEIGVKARVSDEVLGENPCPGALQQVSKRAGQGGCRVLGVGMVGRLHGLSKDTCRAKDAMAGDRALIVAMKRVTTVEPRRAER